MQSSRHAQRGAALIVGMMLLVVLTLLAVVGMNTATTELVMAGNEQYRQRAFQSAEVGLELTLPDLADLNLNENSPPSVSATTAVAGSPTNPITGAATDKYQTTVANVGTTAITAGNSSDFVGHNFTVQSVGTSARNARAVHVVGAYVINNTSGQTSYGP